MPTHKPFGHHDSEICVLNQQVTKQVTIPTADANRSLLPTKHPKTMPEPDTPLFPGNFGNNANWSVAQKTCQWVEKLLKIQSLHKLHQLQYMCSAR
jgi:hypothetical protein